MISRWPQTVEAAGGVHRLGTDLATTQPGKEVLMGSAVSSSPWLIQAATGRAGVQLLAPLMVAPAMGAMARNLSPIQNPAV